MTDGTSVHLKWKQPGVKLSIIDGFVISYMYVYLYEITGGIPLWWRVWWRDFRDYIQPLSYTVCPINYFKACVCVLTLLKCIVIRKKKPGINFCCVSSRLVSICEL